MSLTELPPQWEWRIYRASHGSCASHIPANFFTFAAPFYTSSDDPHRSKHPDSQRNTDSTPCHTSSNSTGEPGGHRYTNRDADVAHPDVRADTQTYRWINGSANGSSDSCPISVARNSSSDGSSDGNSSSDSNSSPDISSDGDGGPDCIADESCGQL